MRNHEDADRSRHPDSSADAVDEVRSAESVTGVPRRDCRAACRLAATRESMTTTPSSRIRRRQQGTAAVQDFEREGVGADDAELEVEPIEEGAGVGPRGFRRATRVHERRDAVHQKCRRAIATQCRKKFQAGPRNDHVRKQAGMTALSGGPSG